MLGEGIPLNLSSERTNASEEICKKFGWNFEKSRTTIQKALKIVVKERKLNPQDYGIGKKIPRFITDLDAKISPEPQPGATEPKQKPTVAPSAGTVQVPQMYMNFTEDGVAASFNAIFLMFRLAYPDLELLTDNEKKALGTMWLPAFNRYLTEKWAIIAVPFIATVGIFLPKIIKARRLKKAEEKEEKETKEKEQNEPEKKPNSNNFTNKASRVWNDNEKRWERKDGS